MSTGFLKKPSRPPPPPPIDGHNRSFSNSFSRGPALGSSNKSATLAAPSHRKPPASSSSRSRSDYIKISDCHTGLPDKSLANKPAGFKSRASTSFSSTLKPTPANDYYPQSSHQKSRSLTDNHRSSSYLYLDLPSSPFGPVASSTGPTGPTGKHGGIGSSSSTLGKSHFSNSHRISNLPSPDDCHASIFSSNTSNNNNNCHSSTVYRMVDFMKTDALNKCKAERTSGRGSDLKSR